MLGLVPVRNLIYIKFKLIKFNYLNLIKLIYLFISRFSRKSRKCLRKAIRGRFWRENRAKFNLIKFKLKI